jgi:hypothetical protein
MPGDGRAQVGTSELDKNAGVCSALLMGLEKNEGAKAAFYLADFHERAAEYGKVYARRLARANTAGSKELNAVMREGIQACRALNIEPKDY